MLPAPEPVCCGHLLQLRAQLKTAEIVLFPLICLSVLPAAAVSFEIAAE